MARLLKTSAYWLARHDGRPGRVFSAGLALLAEVGPREVWLRRREERTLARLWPGRAVNARIWHDAAERLGVGFRDLGQGHFELGSGADAVRVWMHVTPLDDEAARQRALGKELSQRRIAAAGVPVPDRIPFTLADLGPAAAALDGDPWVVKPASGTASGTGVTTGVRDLADLRWAAVRASRSGSELLLERQVRGEEYRVLLLEGEPLGAVRREAPAVVGDGRSTVAALVHAENRRRIEAGGEAGIDMIRLDLDALLALRQEDLGLGSVPAAGRRVAVKGSHSQAGARDAETVALDRFAPELIAELARTVEALGLRFAGVDLISPDPGGSLADAGGAVIEINGTPGLHYHYLVRDPETVVPVAVPVLERMLADRR